AHDPQLVRLEACVTTGRTSGTCIRKCRCMMMRQALSGLGLRASRWKLEGQRYFVLRGYIDDSGNWEHSPVMVLGGWIAPVTTWLSFRPDWQAMLEFAAGHRVLQNERGRDAMRAVRSVEAAAGRRARCVGL